MILINKKFNSAEVVIDGRLLNNLLNTEVIAVELNEILYVAIYVPPQVNVAINQINYIFSLNNKVIIGGELNAKHAAWGNSNNNKSENYSSIT